MKSLLAVYRLVLFSSKLEVFFAGGRSRWW